VFLQKPQPYFFKWSYPKRHIIKVIDLLIV
jgi:hypothetical protein